MFINFKELEKASELIPVSDMEKIINRSTPATNKFSHKYKLKKIKNGRLVFINKTELLTLFDRNNWLPSGWI